MVREENEKDPKGLVEWLVLLWVWLKGNWSLWR